MLAGLTMTRVAVNHRPALVERAEMVLRLIKGRLEGVTPARLTQPTLIASAR